MKRTFSLLLSGALALSACQEPARAGEQSVLAPSAARTSKEAKGLKQAIFAGGCYWGVEGVFSHVRGVTSVVSGFHGGVARTADYERVSGGNTGHAEAVRVTYDPQVVRYDQLLRIFFSVAADPTTLNRQGPDEGTQYRSALVPLGPEQAQVAQAYLAQMRSSGVWKAPIVTRVEGYKAFYLGPEYHQDFMAKNPQHPYILAWDVAKVAALQRRFPGFWKAPYTRG